jgi:hypothetical protein
LLPYNCKTLGPPRACHIKLFTLMIPTSVPQANDLLLPPLSKRLGSFIRLG